MLGLPLLVLGIAPGYAGDCAVIDPVIDRGQCWTVLSIAGWRGTVLGRAAYCLFCWCRDTAGTDAGLILGLILVQYCATLGLVLFWCCCTKCHGESTTLIYTLFLTTQ